jgi:hypothetical protein
MTFSTIAVLAIHARVIAESRRTNVQSNAQILPEKLTRESIDAPHFLNHGGKRKAASGT